MSTKIEIATREDVDEIAKAMADVGLHPSPVKLRERFFDIPSGDVAARGRGGVVVRDGGEIVGYCGLSPCRIHLNGRTYDGYLSGVLGLKPGYGGELFALVDFVKEIVGDSFFIANTANAKSAKLWTVYGEAESGPVMCGFIRYALLPLAVFTVPRLASGDAEVVDFADPRFAVFWQRFLANSQGPFLSRDPQRLHALFDAGIHSRRLVLIVVKEQDSILGYAVMRAKPFMQTPYKRYEIIDVAAIGHAVTVMERLLRQCRRYASHQGGIVIEYVGSIGGLESIVREYLPLRRAALANTAVWYCKIPELATAFAANKGWFFGPYDGDRCM